MRAMRSCRDRMPSLPKMCPRWNSTVLTLTYSSASGLPVGASGGDEAGHRLLGRGQAHQGGRGLWSRRRACGGELPVADLQVGPGAQRDQALPGRAQPGDSLLRLAGGAQPAGVGDLQLGQGQRHPQALGAAPRGLERRRGGALVPGRGGQVAAQPGGGHQDRRRGRPVTVPPPARPAPSPPRPRRPRPIRASISRDPPVEAAQQPCLLRPIRGAHGRGGVDDALEIAAGHGQERLGGGGRSRSSMGRW